MNGTPDSFSRFCLNQCNLLQHILLVLLWADVRLIAHTVIKSTLNELAVQDHVQTQNIMFLRCKLSSSVGGMQQLSESRLLQQQPMSRPTTTPPGRSETIQHLNDLTRLPRLWHLPSQQWNETGEPSGGPQHP